MMDKHPIQGGVEILLVVSRYGNWNKLRPDRPLLVFGYARNSHPP